MSLLLDTHVMLWWLDGAKKLTQGARAAITDPAVTVVVSAATVWEIEIKRALGKLDAPDDLLAQLDVGRFTLLPISAQHAVTAARLPRHHDDPFDRMLIGQALHEQLTVVTRDAHFARYGVALLTA